MDKQDKPLSEWTLGEVQALCERRNGDGCCDECPFANVIGHCILRVLPEEWDLDGGDGAKAERRAGPEPSPTGEACGDNRFELIEKYKKKLVDSTNIETAKDEMAVIDNILFRFWQMGWLDVLEEAYAPTTSAPDMGGRASTRPRLAEVLGVEVGEKFRVLRNGVEYACVIGQDGAPEGTAWEVIYAINHPESIIRAPHLTEPETAIMRAVGAKWVSLDANLIDESVMLWSDKPDNDGDGDFSSTTSALAAVAEELFPSVQPGECIEYKKEETK